MTGWFQVFTRRITGTRERLQQGPPLSNRPVSFHWTEGGAIAHGDTGLRPGAASMLPLAALFWYGRRATDARGAPAAAQGHARSIMIFLFRLSPLLLACALALSSLAPSARAGESAPVVSKRSIATVLTEADSVTPGGRARIALRLRLEAGWHTYWRNPGEAGVPGEVTVELSSGATAGDIAWPVPTRLSEGAVTTYGHTNEVILPVTVTLTPETREASGRLRANWLICKDICVPEEASFPIALPAGPGTPSAQAALFAAHDRAMPRASPWTATIAPDGTLFVRGRELTPATVIDAWFIPDTPGQIVDNAAQLLTPRDGGFTLGLRLANAPTPETRLHGILSVRDKGGSQTDVLLDAAAGAAPPPAVPLGQALNFAFLGGLILNLMPCVFPILAMKAVGFASGLSRGTARAHAAAYTAGVVATFLGLAVVLLLARSASWPWGGGVAGGGVAGWGFQFASPMFVAAMAWLLFAVGLNLSGVFRIGGGLAGMGDSLTRREGHWGAFFTGALAVLVATPCTAPFMSVAIAAGLAAPPLVTLLVFATMGLGLAAPYLALATIPALGRAMPRPGAWMEVFIRRWPSRCMGRRSGCYG